MQPEALKAFLIKWEGPIPFSLLVASALLPTNFSLTVTIQYFLFSFFSFLICFVCVLPLQVSQTLPVTQIAPHLPGPRSPLLTP